MSIETFFRTRKKFSLQEEILYINLNINGQFMYVGRMWKIAPPTITFERRKK